jgi:hypothetical protein
MPMEKIRILFVSENNFIYSLLHFISVDNYQILFDSINNNARCELDGIDVNKYNVIIYDDSNAKVENDQLIDLFKMKNDEHNILLTGKLEQNYLKRMIGCGVRGIVSTRSS